MKPSNFKLLGKPRVTKQIFQVNKDYNISGEISLEISEDIEVIKLPDKEMTAAVILTLSFFRNRELKEIPFELDLEIEGIFSWEQKLDEDSKQLEKLLKENAPAILYSYLRPIITATTIDANLPPLVIPLMNFNRP